MSRRRSVIGIGKFLLGLGLLLGSGCAPREHQSLANQALVYFDPADIRILAENAVNLIDQAQNDSSVAEGYNMAGCAAWLKGDIDGALEAFEQAMGLDDTLLPAYLNHAAVIRLRDGGAGARSLLQNLHDAAPEDDLVQHHRAWNEFSNGLVSADGADHRRQTVSSGTVVETAHLLPSELVYPALNATLVSGGVVNTETDLKLEKLGRVGIFLNAEFALLSAQWSRAEVAFTELLRGDSDDTYVLLRLGALSYRKQDWTAAREYFSRARANEQGATRDYIVLLEILTEGAANGWIGLDVPKSEDPWIDWLGSIAQGSTPNWMIRWRYHPFGEPSSLESYESLRVYGLRHGLPVDLPVNPRDFITTLAVMFPE